MPFDPAFQSARRSERKAAVKERLSWPEEHRRAPKIALEMRTAGSESWIHFLDVPAPLAEEELERFRCVRALFAPVGCATNVMTEKVIVEKTVNPTHKG